MVSSFCLTLVFQVSQGCVDADQEEADEVASLLME